MDEYVEIQNHRFQLLRTGDYIRWYDTFDGKKTFVVGGAIEQIGITHSGKKNWTVSGFRGQFTLYWERYASVWVRRTAEFDWLEARVEVISKALKDLAVQLDMFGEYKEILGKIGALRAVQEKRIRAREQKKRTRAARRRKRLFG